MKTTTTKKTLINVSPSGAAAGAMPLRWEQLTIDVVMRCIARIVDVKSILV